MDRQLHWNSAYVSQNEEGLTWFEDTPKQSLDLVQNYSNPTDGVIDVGAGAARLVDGLLEAGYSDVTLLDVSNKALDITKTRLGADYNRPTYLVTDITRWHPMRKFQIWHDRAMLHFLSDEMSKEAYFGCMSAALKSGGYAILSTFSQEGPEKCAGLSVQRYSSAFLFDTVDLEIRDGFEKVDQRQHMHKTPSGNLQAYQTLVIRKK